MRFSMITSAAVVLVSWVVPASAASADGARLEARELEAGAQPTALVANAAFVPGADARPAHSAFRGDLEITETRMQTQPGDLKLHALLGKDTQFFPGVRLSFITVDGDLVPATQEVIRAGSLPGGRSYWDVIVQPGRVWSTPEDGGWSRAAFPFALVHSLEGETHNGYATFLYRGREISALRYQIVTQTTPGHVEVMFTAFGSAPARWEPAVVADSAAIGRRHRAALADAVPIRPWAALEQKVGAVAPAGFSDGLSAEETILTGLDYHGVFYLHDCTSAAGPLPWCDRMRFGVWSVTKAYANEVALLRLAQKYGPAVLKARIADYVPAVKGHPAWAEVTFDDCINMATGIGNGSAKREPNDIVDGYLDPTYYEWGDAPSRDAKVAALLRIGKVYPWGRGQVARYRDQDMFVLGVAMDAYLKSREGASADLWTMLEREVYGPIGIHDAPTNRTIEAAGRGHPLMAYGVYATIDDLVKVARLYQAGGRWRGEQILYAPRIAMLRAGTSARGLPTGEHSADGETTYFNAFWEVRYDGAKGCKLYIPQMVGWGSNLVALYPGGLTGIRIAHAPPDGTGSPEDPLAMARAVDRIANSCD